MKYNNTYRYILLLPLLILCSCQPQVQFKYAKKEAVLVRSLREQMFYEYSSPLNNAMKIYMELELAKEPDIKLPLEKIKATEAKIQKEQPQTGCYYYESTIPQSDKKIFIIMEWNPNAGVIIRIFTDSNHLIEKLPNNSF